MSTNVQCKQTADWSLRFCCATLYMYLGLMTARKSRSYPIVSTIDPNAFQNTLTNQPIPRSSNSDTFFQVSWIRDETTHLLTIGRLTYTSDMRFKAIHKLYSEDYLLQIKPTTHRDSGKYSCQISTTPPNSHIVHLTIAGKKKHLFLLCSPAFRLCACFDCTPITQPAIS